MTRACSSAADRFDAQYEPEPNSGCWFWTGARGRTGYGRFAWDGHDGYAHRAAYERFVDFVPEGLDLDHRCRVRSCVNPAHLEPVTRRENLLRSELTRTSINAKATACPHGHSYNAINTRFEPDGHRRCRYCSNANVKRWKQRRRQSV